MSTWWGKALLDGKRWDYYGSVELNPALNLVIIRALWPVFEEALRSTTAEVQLSIVANLKQAIIEYYKTRLPSIRAELAAFPQVIVACEAQVSNLQQFFETIIGLIAGGPSGDSAHYLSDLMVAGSLSRSSSVAFHNECMRNVFCPFFATDEQLAGSMTSSLLANSIGG